MLNLIKYRIAVVALLFAAFGGALASVVGIDDLKMQYVGLACLIAFIINLLVSFLLKQMWKKQFRTRLQIISFTLFIFLVVSIAFHVYFFQMNTFRYTGFNKATSYHIKGDAYTYFGDSVMKAHPLMGPSDVLAKIMGGAHEADLLWKGETITKNKLILLASYGLIIIFFSFLVSILVEVLALKYPKSSLK